MKALSLWQPWASLVGEKLIETRSWSSSFRGIIAIHAAKRWTGDEKRLARTEPFLTGLRNAGKERTSLPGLGVITLPLGKVVAVARLWHVAQIGSGPRSFGFKLTRGGAVLGGHPDDVANDPTPGGVVYLVPPPEPEHSFGDYTPGRYAWLLCDVVRLPEPVACAGARGLFDLPAEVAAIVEAAVLAARGGAS